MTYSYLTHGLIVHSEIKFPELREAEGKADFFIKYATVPENLSEIKSKGACYQSNSNEYLLKIENVGLFYITEGKNIFVQSIGRQVKESEIRIFILGSSMGALLHQRGDYLPIHASAVLIDGKAVLFTGMSGSGKSTTATAFHKNGYTFLSDDISAIKFDEKQNPVLYPSFSNIKLWEDAMMKLSLENSKKIKIRQEIEKFSINIDMEKKIERPIPVIALYRMDISNQPHHYFEELLPFEKFQFVLKSIFRSRIRRGLNNPQLFKFGELLAKKIKVKRFYRPKRGFDFDGLINKVLNDLKK